MKSSQSSEIQDISIHYTGNRVNGEQLRLSKSPVKLGLEVSDLLSSYFLSAFKSQEYFTFFHESDLKLNEVFVYCERIFDDPDSLHEQSQNLAKHLYDKSSHPKIKGGEFYTVFFRNCVLNNESFEAIGLFKSESRETFLKVYPQGDSYSVESDEGINIHKLDKGCLIFNMEKESGYRVMVVDNTNKGVEALYWTDDFLQIRPKRDEYYKTQNILTICKNFVTQELPQHFEVSKADQADLLNRSVKFFRDNEEFNMKEFSNEVMESPEVIKTFNKYRKNYQEEYDIEMDDQFAISDSAVKKQARIFKSVIKLDRNFHIYIHGNRNMIEQGVDESGRKFYKIFYQEEM